MGQQTLQHSGIFAFIVIVKEIYVYKAPCNNEHTENSEESADRKEDLLYKGDDFFELFEFRVHYATPPL